MAILGNLIYPVSWSWITGRLWIGIKPQCTCLVIFSNAYPGHVSLSILTVRYSCQNWLVVWFRGEERRLMKNRPPCGSQTICNVVWFPLLTLFTKSNARNLSKICQIISLKTNLVRWVYKGLKLKRFPPTYKLIFVMKFMHLVSKYLLKCVCYTKEVSMAVGKIYGFRKVLATPLHCNNMCLQMQNSIFIDIWTNHQQT